MKTINFWYRTKKYGTWKKDQIETNIPDLSNKELLHLCQQQIDEKALQVTQTNPKSF